MARMSMGSRLRSVLELEVFLFGGTAETPQPVYERDAHHNRENRLTRMEAPKHIRTPRRQGIVVGSLVADAETGEVKAVKHTRRCKSRVSRKRRS